MPGDSRDQHYFPNLSCLSELPLILGDNSTSANAAQLPEQARFASACSKTIYNNVHRRFQLIDSSSRVGFCGALRVGVSH